MIRSAALLFRHSRCFRKDTVTAAGDSLHLTNLGFQDNNTTSKENFLELNQLFSNILKKELPKVKTMDKKPKPILNYSELMKQKLSTGSSKEVEDALQGTIKYLGSLNSNHELLKYCLALVEEFDTQPRIEKLNLDAIKSQTKPETPVLNQFTFPILMKHGLIKLNDLKSPLEAITLFETVKNKELHTFISGCGIVNYNEYIKLQWSCFQDINKILTILEQLKVNGIQGNFETLDILSDIKNEYSDLISQDDLIQSSTYIWSERNENDLRKLTLHLRDLTQYLG